ncbi:hypothetical protein EI42_02064 [Thermosporothrix hazakensis]|uniref:Uncharacterized protein n=2 Tax=Thermosporothrix TaxID=768650 RepID=A0A326UIT1_THEHA|nr:hypothetical protein [Thermosporothrix hazakensis]PZW32038.1 hypothetical protein EI42_02064 [Thermosporothrix hazakensis]BBH91489.1 hypothetical protein KTC_62400 [Thermosporothrix sp. COM3]GCE49634.1 hypothetical protein KTH_45030 [Thermosporothrix hazakensis]
MEHQKQPRYHYDEFSSQFVALLLEFWADIVPFVHRQSPRVASLLRVATPLELKRKNGTWCIRVLIPQLGPRDRLSQPRDNEIVAQAIRLWAHTVAHFKLPFVMVEFDVKQPA